MFNIIFDVLFTFSKHLLNDTIDLLLECSELTIQDFGHFAVENINFVVNIGYLSLNFHRQIV